MVSGTGQWRSYFLWHLRSFPRSLDSRKLSPTRVCRVFWRVPEAGFLPTEGQLGRSDWLIKAISGSVSMLARDVAWASHPFFGASGINTTISRSRADDIVRCQIS